MNPKGSALTTCFWLATACALHGQGSFQNLGFELASVPSIPPYHALVPATDALPGWIVYAGPYQQTQIWYNGVSAGGALVTIIDANDPYAADDIMEGKFTVTLGSGVYYIDPYTAISTSAAIAQTGTIPAGTKTLLFDARWYHSALQVTFSGQVLPFYALSSGSNYTRYGADVSALAGQTAELRFTELINPAPPPVGVVTYLDDIEFSPESIPEPSTVGLFVLGALLLACRLPRKRNHEP